MNRRELLDAVRAYHESTSQPRPFVPGQSPVPVNGRVFDADDVEVLVSSALDFWLTHGPYANRFETDFAKFCGANHAVLCNSGSSANLLAMAATLSPKSRFQPGDEVITVAAAFPTTVNPIVQLGGRPVFVDVEIPSYNVDISQLARAYSNRTRGVILAHTLGNPFNIGAVLDFCETHGIWLIEDCCDAIGSTWHGRQVGTFGNYGTASFFPAHIITCGEGGCVLTKTHTQRRKLESFRDWGRACWCATGHDDTCQKRFDWQLGELPHGFDHKFTYAHIGYNLKATDLQAAILVSQLQKMPAFIQARKANYQFLRTQLGDLDDLLMFTDAAPSSDPCWFGFPIAVRAKAHFTRNDMVRHLNKKKIATRLLFTGNITKHPAYQDIDYGVVGPLVNSDFVTNNVFWIGVYPGLTNEMLEYMVATIRSFVRG
jgi:CDP-4-dehydro-6-deoxyglucose reductase, E1